MHMYKGEGGFMEHGAKKELIMGFMIGAMVGSAITLKTMMHAAKMMGFFEMGGKHPMMGPWGHPMEGMWMRARKHMMMMRKHWMDKGCCEEEEEEEEPQEKPAEEQKPQGM
jgi:hypothetical protein